MIYTGHSRQLAALSRIAGILNRLGQTLSLFELYNQSIDLNDEILENVFDLLVVLVMHTGQAIKH